MKWVFIMLLVLNLVYLGWELDRQAVIDQDQSSDAISIPPHTKKLALVKELATPPESRVEPEAQDESSGGVDAGGETAAPGDVIPVEDVMIDEKFTQELFAQMPEISASERMEIPDTTAPMCFSFGPIPDEKQSKDLKAWFEQRQVLVQQREKQDQEDNLFWIYLAPQDSLGDAMQAIEDLKKKGIVDYRLIKTGDLRHAISLGLFSSQAAVNKRLNELKGKGYQPIVVPHRKANLIYWIDVELVNQRDLLNQMLIEYPSRYNSVPVTCSEIAIPRNAP